MSNKWTIEEIDFIKNNYKNMTYKELSQKLNRSKSAIDLKINRLGLKKSKYIYNYDYFENIDSNDKAYWLGFIMADGMIHVREDLNSCEVCIKLQISDVNHLKKFNKAICGNVQVTTGSKICNLNNKLYQYCQIRLYSEKMAHDLIKLGVVPNKTYHMKFPEIQEKYYKDFIRGYFDGDGSVYENKHKNSMSSIAANFTCYSKEFLLYLQKILLKNNIYSYLCESDDRAPQLRIGGMKNTHHFLYYIYNDKHCFLDRKFEKTKYLYKHLNIEQRLLRHSEMSGSFINEEESGNPEMGIRVEGNK